MTPSSFARARHDPLPSAAATAYRRDIDGLRALAVLAVIVHHFSLEALPSGYLGVDIFFVISGYVITASLITRPGDSFVDFLLGFYSRRIKRLLPALLLFVVVTALLISLFNPAPAKSLRTGITALFGFSNIALFNGATDYFAETARLNAFTHTWSLGVEEQFYLVFPLLLWFSGGARGRSSVTSLVLALASVLSFAAFAILTRVHPNAAYFLMPFRFWELSVGALLCLAVARDARTARLLQRLNPLVPLSALVAVLLAPVEWFVVTTPAVVALTALLIGSLRQNSAAFQVLAHPWTVHIGKISYSLYLWHWTVLVISRWTVGIHWWSIPLQAAAMWGAAEASYRAVENPLRRSSWSTRRSLTLAKGFGAALAAGAVLAVLAGPLKGQLYTGRTPAMAAIGVETLQAPHRGPDGTSHWLGAPCVISAPGQVDKRIEPADCTLGRFDTARRRVLVAGDSVAAAFVPAFDSLVREDGYAVTITSAWAAPPIPSIATAGPWSAAHHHYWSDVFAELTGRLRPGDWVFLISNLSAFASPKVRSDADTVGELERGLTALSQDLQRRGVRLAVLNGLPFAHEAECEPVVAMKQWFAPFGGPCRYYTRHDTMQRRAGLDAALARLQHAGAIYVVDLMDVYCPGELCTYVAASGELLYRDATSHPSVEAARLSAARIRDVLRQDPPAL